MNRTCKMLTFCLLTAMLMVSLASSGIPKECTSYRSLNTHSRKNTWFSTDLKCRDNRLRSGWYRFKGKAGKEMASSCPAIGKCGSRNPGWLRGDPLPLKSSFRNFTREVCFRYGSNCCKESVTVKIRQCGNFFVYYLTKTSCYQRYCGSDGPPKECLNYGWLTDPQRAISRTSIHSQCDNDLENGWYRFGGSAGSAMATECVPTNHCGGKATGWLRGSHPLKRFQIVRRVVCFHWDDNCCGMWNSRIRVRKCDGFYVYYLYKTRPFSTELGKNCSLRYCGNKKRDPPVPGPTAITTRNTEMSTDKAKGPPRIIEMQVVRLVSKKNDTVFITCKVSGAQPMSVSWFMYEDNVKTPRLKTVAGARNELEIATAGVYECQVENRLGTFSKEITVSPQDIEKLMTLRQKVETQSDAKVNFTLIGLVVGFSLIIIILFVVVAFLCWKMKKQQKVENATAVNLPSLNRQNKSTKEGINSFTQNNLKQNLNRSPLPLPPDSSAQTQNSNYEGQHYMELQTPGQRSSNGYDYALHAYEVTH